MPSLATPVDIGIKHSEYQHQEVRHSPLQDVVQTDPVVLICKQTNSLPKTQRDRAHGGLSIAGRRDGHVHGRNPL